MIPEGWQHMRALCDQQVSKPVWGDILGCASDEGHILRREFKNLRRHLRRLGSSDLGSTSAAAIQEADRVAESSDYWKAGGTFYQKTLNAASRAGAAESVKLQRHNRLYRMLRFHEEYWIEKSK